MTTTSNGLSVVIVNYHSVDYVRRCVADFDSSWCRRLIIVDNSTAASETTALQELALGVPFIIITEPENVGFGTAANHGIDRALAEDPETPVWLLNPDTEPAPGAPSALLRRLERGSDDILSPTVITGHAGDRRIWFAGGTADRSTGNVTHANYLEPYRDDSEDGFAPTTFMCGAAPVFTPDAWKALGGFREDLFLYWEDAEISLRAQDLGLRMTIAADAVVWHAVGGTGEGSGQSRNFYYYSARNRVSIMVERHGLRVLLRPRSLVQLLKFSLRPVRRETHEPLIKMLLTVRGYGTGIRLGRLHTNGPARRDGTPDRETLA
ncbi:glycosyltransferase family 2 protein [Curtobacterium citreum]|uniref:glycosyltransferase family 2 protein n=1 Tax=Curtobacterium citreum TaxID=2036 RepID=UPI000B2FFC40|nr:glycosyltransferase family 2 protein [Curtobacterium citreum]